MVVLCNHGVSTQDNVIIKASTLAEKSTKLFIQLPPVNLLLVLQRKLIDDVSGVGVIQWFTNISQTHFTKCRTN